MNSTLKKYVKKHYKDYSCGSVLVFIWHNINMAKAQRLCQLYDTGFLDVFEIVRKLRDSVLQLTSIASLIQMGDTRLSSMRCTVTINTFVLKKATDKNR
ncbi:hypothetical protein ACW18Z_06805 [Limosilactobacillus fermentum]